MTTQLTHNEVCELVLAYITNVRPAHEIANELGVDEEKASLILNEASDAWDEADCDAEGPTTEQDKQLDAILGDAANELIALL